MEDLLTDLRILVCKNINITDNIILFQCCKQYYNDKKLWEYLYMTNFEKTKMYDDNITYNELVILCLRLQNLTKLKQFKNYNIKRLYIMKCINEEAILHDDFFFGKIKILINLCGLKSSWNRTEYVSDELFYLTQLNYLNIADNRIKTISSNISKLNNLTELNFTSNQINNIPIEICFLTNLIKLEINNNQITSIIKEIGSLTNLQKLELNNNKIEIIPNYIFTLKNLKFFDLSHNNIKTIPWVLTKLTSLCDLNLRNNNKIFNMPKYIGNLKNHLGLYKI
jgi:Leucine-rich repeat (LRR) protein